MGSAMIETGLVADYTNWKDIKRKRYIKPVKIWFGHTNWHKSDQWLMTAVDMEDGKVKDFAMVDFDFAIDQDLGGIKIPEEIKTCPFCGEHAILREWDCSNSSNRHAEIECTECDASMEAHECFQRMDRNPAIPTHVEKVTTAWNKRT